MKILSFQSNASINILAQLTRNALDFFFLNMGKFDSIKIFEFSVSLQQPDSFCSFSEWSQLIIYLVFSETRLTQFPFAPSLFVPFKRGGAPVLTPQPGALRCAPGGVGTESALTESGRVGNLPGGAPCNSMHAVKA